MRRWLGAVVIVALVAVLYPGIAFAGLHPALQSVSAEDFGSQLFHRVFFEAESTVRFSPNDGDRLSASFFRKYALRVAESPVGRGTASITIPAVALPLLRLHLFEPGNVAVLCPNHLEQLGIGAAVGERSIDARERRLRVAGLAAAHEHLGARRARQLHQIRRAAASQRRDRLGDL